MNTIKDLKQTMCDDLIKSCMVFFAFSNEQFQESKTPLKEGEKYVSIGNGGYMPKGQLENWENGWKAIAAAEKAAKKDIKTMNDYILYELCNHEAFYTGDVNETVEALGDGYTKAQVLAVYKKNYNVQTANM